MKGWTVRKERACVERTDWGRRARVRVPVLVLAALPVLLVAMLALPPPAAIAAIAAIAAAAAAAVTAAAGLLSLVPVSRARVTAGRVR